MAQKRMFSLAVTDTDAFLDLPASAQALYFHLGMHGDDDGFVASPKKIMRSVSCSEDDLKILAAKGFVILFKSGVLVIRDWRINNTLKNDRYHPTIYSAEKASLTLDESGRYAVNDGMVPDCLQTVSALEPERNLTKRNVTQPSMYGRPLTVEEVETYGKTIGRESSAQAFFDYYSANGWRKGGQPVADWKAAFRCWRDLDEERKTGLGRGLNNEQREAAARSLIKFG